jgi:hypothetical protein
MIYSSSTRHLPRPKYSRALEAVLRPQLCGMCTRQLPPQVRTVSQSPRPAKQCKWQSVVPNKNGAEVRKNSGNDWAGADRVAVGLSVASLIAPKKAAHARILPDKFLDCDRNASSDGGIACPHTEWVGLPAFSRECRSTDFLLQSNKLRRSHTRALASYPWHRDYEARVDRSWLGQMSQSSRR